MSRYLFKVTSGNAELPNDPDSEEFADLEAARRYAEQALREMLSNAIAGGKPLDVDGIDIMDQGGQVLLSVPLPGEQGVVR